jgi:general stress protein YciG
MAVDRDTGEFFARRRRASTPRGVDPAFRARICAPSRRCPAVDHFRTEMIAGRDMIRTRRRKAKRGFAAMSPEKRREIARKGGQSVKPENRAFAQDRQLAADAGRKGGSQSPGKRRRRRLTPRRVAATAVAAELASAPIAAEFPLAAE